MKPNLSHMLFCFAPANKQRRGHTSISGDGIIHACFHFPYQDLIQEYVHVQRCTYLLTRNSSPRQLHTCSIAYSQL